MIGRDFIKFQSSMIVLLNLFITMVVRKVTTSDINYRMTLNKIFVAPSYFTF